MNEGRSVVDLDHSDDSRIDRSTASNEVALGQWYWVKSIDRRVEGEERESEWLGCVMHIGSNYLELKAPPEKYRSFTTRVHFDDFYRILRRELDPDAYIQSQVRRYQGEAQEYMDQVQAITNRLGVTDRKLLGQAGESRLDGCGRALMVVSAAADVQGYRNALTLAKTEELPALFKEIERAHACMAVWMGANALPMQAAAGAMKSSLGEIDSRIFTVSLYAGLTEEVEKVRDGEPAGYAEKLRVMQRRLYMDEECLLGYRTGGMEFKDIGAFDSWISEPENMNRILPFPRCLVAMRVRRTTKERDVDGSLQSTLIRFHLDNADKLTFLYICNGDQLYRLSCDLQFEELIFPSRDEFDPSEPLMFNTFAGNVREFITRADYDQRVAGHEQSLANSERWRAENSKEDWFRNPYDRGAAIRFEPRNWHPFDPSSVYFDDAMEQVSDRIRQYNRIAVILQGLFDRSEVLHPHPPVKTWTSDGFARAIELVYDGSAVLHYGEPPDFEAYRARCNRSLAHGSVVVGQELCWMEQEAEKENRRRERDWRRSSRDRPAVKTFRPQGNPGPGYLAVIGEWQARARKAVFSWERTRLRDGSDAYFNPKERAGGKIPVSITVPDTRLFNVSAYRPGDFKQFYRDPRTRAQYLKWAPMLLAAEEYHAGNMKPRTPAVGAA